MLEQNPLVIKVKEIASQELPDIPVGRGGDYFDQGYDSGRIELAREILDTLGIKY